MKKQFVVVLIFFVAMLAGCRQGVDVAAEFPTQPAPAASTPAPPIEYKPDAELERQFSEISKAAKGRIGVAAVVIENGNAAFFNADQRFPMQSVYKLPIAMAVIEKIKRGELELDEKIAVTKDDMVRQGMASTLREEKPDGGEFTIRELIRLALVESDGTASDVLMRIAGGASEIQTHLTQIGVSDVNVVNTEKEIGLDWQTQYENWATPAGAAELLRWLHKASDCGCSEIDPLTKPAEELTGPTLLIKYMADSKPGANRLKSLLPKDTVVAHKTGTGGSQNGVSSATNDIGIIRLPSGDHLAIAVFVSDSPADEKTREAVIAKIAKAAWERWNK